MKNIVQHLYCSSKTELRSGVDTHSEYMFAPGFRNLYTPVSTALAPLKLTTETNYFETNTNTHESNEMRKVCPLSLKSDWTNQEDTDPPEISIL